MDRGDLHHRRCRHRRAPRTRAGGRLGHHLERQPHDARVELHRHRLGVHRPAGVQPDPAVRHHRRSPTRAAEAIDYNGSPAALAAGVTVTADQQTGALRISTTQETADEAVAVADAFADELTTYLAERQDTAPRQDRLASTLARLEELEAEIRAVEVEVLIPPADPFAEGALPTEDPVKRAQLDALTRQYSVVFEQFNSLQQDQGQLVLTTLERAQPVAITERGLSAPRSRVGRAMLGGIAGFAIGVGIALLLGRADRKIRSVEQAEELLGLPANTTIPLVKRHDTSVLAVTPGRHDPLSDSYRTLRSMLVFLDNEKPRAARPRQRHPRRVARAGRRQDLGQRQPRRCDGRIRRTHRGRQHRLPPPHPQRPPRRRRPRTCRPRTARSGEPASRHRSHPPSPTPAEAIPGYGANRDAWLGNLGQL